MTANNVINGLLFRYCRAWLQITRSEGICACSNPEQGGPCPNRRLVTTLSGCLEHDHGPQEAWEQIKSSERAAELDVMRKEFKARMSEEERSEVVKGESDINRSGKV